MNSKIERIKELRKHNLNTPDYILFKEISELRKFLRRKKRGEKISLRTYSKIDEIREFQNPFFPNTCVGEIMKYLDKMKDLNIIVSKPIDPKDSEWAGNIGFSQSKILLEFGKGPGTVRELVVKKKPEYSIQTNLENFLMDIDIPKLQEPIMFLSQSNISLENRIFEVSIYNTLIGWKKEKIIFWEFRPFK